MDPWIHESMDPWIHESMHSGIIESMDPWIQGMDFYVGSNNMLYNHSEHHSERMFEQFVQNVWNTFGTRCETNIAQGAVWE